ncbi:alpha-L-fucosidase [Sinomicrobium weinanense]|uniref:alpha-L-fucosidase n=1 Tax=Sinomicrobium weinanense TaxID=2842200 RepID=A0A926JSC2_9FLAO|nr:alpha-L-fucosidase [Sinomicrobium weinanense]MBC9796620.1 alpha-L-fucosidase [Sinomicrobium weinanense]MBU3123856.1 alpha-L-fucosidase [Sinomicrobium weinanense]
MMRNIISSVCMLCCYLLIAQESSVRNGKEPVAEGKFEPTWESLSDIEREPEWFKDAKFGIYFHWGVYSVPAYSSEWYPRWMYVPGREDWGGDIFEHHRKTYGPLSEFNYHDFIPMFTAEHFDAKEWAALFKKTGARFAGPVAQHHDGFAMWDSKVNPWNAKDMGPKKDILGELFAELKKNDMKTIATFHHARLLQRYAKDTSNWAGNRPDPGWNSHYPYHPDYVTSTIDPKLRMLYGNIPADEFHEYWLNQVNEVVDVYAPDIIWFDSWLDKIPENYRQKMVAHHFNTAVSRGQAPIVAYKQEDLPANVGILDIEQGGKTEISDDYWLTDITLSNDSWSYIHGQTYKPAALVIRNMVDVWSKKGIVLLNISPKANGTIPAEQRSVLAAIGKWIDKHKEAVYGTRAHSTYGYGDAEFEKGHFGGQSATIAYSEKDIRFTVSKDKKYLYVFSLGLPAPGSDLVIRTPIESGIKKVSVLGSGKELRWTVTDNLLTLTTPGPSDMNELATVFKVELE